MKETEYFVGFDIGTGSVGWAVTDEQYNLIKINRKNAWGSVLFDTSLGAESRRVNRCARRRLKRQKERLSLLRELFEEEINKIDSGFFIRLKESRYVSDDKRDEYGNKPELPYSLFVDTDYTDVEYHKEFPTIYHLRKALILEDREFDVRLVYLAIASILKNRGHFLANMDTNEVKLDFKQTFIELIEAWNVYLGEEQKQELSENQLVDVESILKDTKMPKSMKKQGIIELLNNTNKAFKELVSLITGGKVSLAKLFNCPEFDDLEENKITFDDASYDDKEELYASELGACFDVISKARAVYNWMILSGIIKAGEDNKEGYISVAKVKDYEKHSYDLKLLKRVIKECSLKSEDDRRSLYKMVFGVPAKGVNNYSRYIGMTCVKRKKYAFEGGKCTKGDFYDFIRKQVLPIIDDGSDKDYIETQITLGTFMPKLRVNDNSVVPYQINAKELKKILDNAEKYLPFLKEIDDCGNSVSDKIMMLLTFRIPYYVGPLNPTHDNAWVVRKTNGKVTPWNFEDKVDADASAKEFILRMTSKCTYLKNEDVLPASSLLYEKYKVLNEINNLKIFSEPISVELKQRIYTNLFERKLKVTVKKLIDYLKREEPRYANVTKDDISGIDVEIKSSLKSYHAFKSFTDCNLSEAEKEDIIKDMTLFGAEPKLLKKRLLAKYPGYENQLTALMKSLSCKEWGRLSEKLLNGIAVDIPGQGKIGTVMYMLWNGCNNSDRKENTNLQQILAVKDSPFAKLIAQENGYESDKEIKYSLVEDLYVAPAVKRQIWKSIQVLDEVMYAMGHPPKRVFVEMMREHRDSNRSVTRKDSLLELYKSLGSEKELLEQLKGEDNDKLRRDQLYLYYTQLGRCAYTGQKIEIDEIGTKYDIDHIYPRSKTADDSLDNRVLVSKSINQGEKKDVYPIGSVIQNLMHDTWLMWKQRGLISEEKYKRLIRTTEFTNEELTGFVNRQLVETSQGTKAFMDVLKSILPESTELVYSKAKNVSKFRQEFKILKVRELNDLHHAKDAYLNIVVGNVFHLKFTKDVRKYFSNYGTYRTYNLTKMYEKDVEYKGEMAWIAGDKGTITTVKKTLSSDKVLVTRQVYERKGQLFDVQPLKKGKGQIPLKSGTGNERLGSIEKYGGYDSATVSYFILIEGEDKKGKTLRYIAPVPLYLRNKISSNIDFAVSYYGELFKLKNVRVIIDKILMQTLLVCEGFKMRITGRSESRIVLNNANQLSMEMMYHKTLKEVSKFVADCKEKRDNKVNEKSGIVKEKLVDIYDEFLDKVEDTVYKEMFSSISKVLRDGRDKFVGLTLEEQAIQIFELLKLFQCTAEMPDLSRVGGKKNTGRIRIGMNVTERKNLAIIHQSVTGLYEQIERINV